MLTGDIHNNRVFDLKEDFSEPSSRTVGTEFVGTSISSSGDRPRERNGGEWLTVYGDQEGLNDHQKFYDNHRGYVRCTLTRNEWRSDFRVIETIQSPTSPVSTVASFVVEDGRPGAHLASEGVEVVGECATGEETTPMVQKCRPDVLVLGLNPTGETDGVEACRAVKALPGAPKVLIHTAYNFAEDVSSCFLAGADSYLHKSTALDTLLDALRCTVAGERVWMPGERVGRPEAAWPRLRRTSG